jgi:hypothetical protein
MSGWFLTIEQPWASLIMLGAKPFGSALQSGLGERLRSRVSDLGDQMWHPEGHGS